MKRTIVELDGIEFVLFELEVFGDVVSVAEERLNTYIEEQIEKDRYHKVSHVDETYAYYVPQEIADTNNEDEIRMSVEDAILSFT